MMRLPSSLLFLLLTILLTLTLHSTTLTAVSAYPAPPVLKIGAVLPLTGPLAGAGYRTWLLLNLSLSELTTNIPGILNGTKLQLVVADSAGTQVGTTKATLQLAKQNVVAIIGGAEGMNLIAPSTMPVNATKKSTSSTGGIGSGYAEVAVLAWTANSLPEPLAVLAVSGSACESRAFQDLDSFPQLIRMCTKLTTKAQAMLATFKAFGWQKMAIIAQDSNGGWGTNSQANKDAKGNILAPGQGEVDMLIHELSLQTSLEYMNRNVLRLRLPATPALVYALMVQHLQKIKDSGYRIIVVYIQGALLVQMMRLANSMDMLRSPYVWVGAGSNAGPSSTMGLGTGSGLVSSGGVGIGLCSHAMRDAMADLTPNIPSIDASAGGLISSYQSSNIGAQSSAATYVYQTDLAFVSSPLLGSICFSPAIPRTPNINNLKYRLDRLGLTFNSILNGADAAVYDSILVYATAFDSLIKQQKNVSSTGIWSVSDVYNAVLNVSLPSQGMIPNLKFDSSAARVASVDIWGYDPYGSSSGGFTKRGTWSSATGNLTLDDAIIWSDGTTILPPDHVDPFIQGQIITYTTDSSILALSYFFVLLPALVLLYNARRFVRGFIEYTIGRSNISIPGINSTPTEKQWYVDGLRALLLFSLPGVFGMMYLNLLAITFPTGDLLFSRNGFISGVFLCFFIFTCLVFLPLLAEIYYITHKANADASTEVYEDYELHLENGEEVVAQDVAAAGGKDAAKGKDLKDKDQPLKLAPSQRERARSERKKAKSGKLQRQDEASFLESELVLVWEKTTIGLVVTSVIFSTLLSVFFYQTLSALIVPLTSSITISKAFGVWVFQFLALHFCLVRIWKDSRNVGRLLGAFFLTLTMFCAFHANMSCVVWTYDGTKNLTSTETIDLGGVAITHAILFAIPFFVGLLQLIKALKLSRHSLDAVLNNMKLKLATLEVTLEQSKTERKNQASEADHFKRLIELANLCRPLHRNHALAFTMAETTGNGGDNVNPNANKPFVPASFMHDVGGGMKKDPFAGASSSGASTPLAGAAGRAGSIFASSALRQGLSIKLPAGGIGAAAGGGNNSGNNSPIQPPSAGGMLTLPGGGASGNDLPPSPSVNALTSPVAAHSAPASPKHGGGGSPKPFSTASAVTPSPGSAAAIARRPSLGPEPLSLGPAVGTQAATLFPPGTLRKPSLPTGDTTLASAAAGAGGSAAGSANPSRRGSVAVGSEAATAAGALLSTSAAANRSAENSRRPSLAPPQSSQGGGGGGHTASQGIANINGLDFGFLARPKAELTGYKLLNELSLELFLGSGPVHHRAVADIHLSHILSHPLTLELFKDTLTRSGAQESLTFWLDIQRFKQLDDDSLRRTISEAMVATFLYSDAPYPIGNNIISSATREQLLNIIFAKKTVKSSLFQYVESELLVSIQKDFTNFITTTNFKVCAFLLGHSSYRPSTRIKTLNPGGAVIGDGGKMMQITQVNRDQTGMGGVEASGGGSARDEMETSLVSGNVGGKSIGAGLGLVGMDGPLSVKGSTNNRAGGPSSTTTPAGAAKKYLSSSAAVGSPSTGKAGSGGIKTSPKLANIAVSTPAAAGGNDSRRGSFLQHKKSAIAADQMMAPHLAPDNPDEEADGGLGAVDSENEEAEKMPLSPNQ